MMESVQTDGKRGENRYFKAPVFAVAPMIDWTDRHYRFFARQLSSHALLYTEMIVADAILRGDREKLLGHDTSEHPVACSSAAAIRRRWRRRRGSPKASATTRST